MPAPWVQYKLDQGIDHILLDEAQDTSPDQWSVVRRLAEEFFAGVGARDNVHRTVFAVGDEKQSIYSFQGAAPESFAETGIEFSATGARGQCRLRAGAADAVVPLDQRRAARGRPGLRQRRGAARHHPRSRPGRHNAIRFDAPGYVEVWPSLGADAVEEPDDWTQAVDHAQAPAVRVAETVAARSSTGSTPARSSKARARG